MFPDYRSIMMARFGLGQPSPQPLDSQMGAPVSGVGPSFKTPGAYIPTPNQFTGGPSAWIPTPTPIGGEPEGRTPRPRTDGQSQDIGGLMSGGAMRNLYRTRY